MNRHQVTSGMSLIEMAAVISITGFLLGGSMTVLRNLQRLAQADTARGVRAELACDQLRRDLAHASVEIVADGVQIQIRDQTVQWRLNAGHLERNGRQMLAVDRFDTQSHPPRLSLIITPTGLPTRQIESSP